MKRMLKITQVYYENAYRDEVTIMPDVWWGRLIHRFYKWLEKYQMDVASKDAKRFQLQAGELFPKYSRTWWCFQPIRFANEYFPRVDGGQFRMREDEILGVLED